MKALSVRPQAVTFSELAKVCEHYFGQARQKGTSHMIFKTGLAEMPLVNIQAAGKMAKPYQCRQVATAIALKAKEE
ncbi:MAG TPA: toxin HicA [Thermoanaerobaculia bacterium]